MKKLIYLDSLWNWNLFKICIGVYSSTIVKVAKRGSGEPINVSRWRDTIVLCSRKAVSETVHRNGTIANTNIMCNLSIICVDGKKRKRVF